MSAGGEAEYGADSDVLDDGWIPRIWNPLFGTATFMHNIQPWIDKAPPWEVEFAPGYTPGAPGLTTAQLADVGNVISAAVALENFTAPEPVARTG